MNKKLIITFVLSALIFSGCTLKQKKQVGTPASKPAEQQQKQQQQPATKNTGISMSDVSNHNSAKDCWFVIDNSVYDVTNYISKHPGGVVITQGCGKDASQLFHAVKKHKGQVLNLLSGLKIGDLSN